MASVPVETPVLCEQCPKTQNRQDRGIEDVNARLAIHALGRRYVSAAMHRMISDANCSRYNVILSLRNAIGASIITLLVHIVELPVFRQVLVPETKAASLHP